MRNLLR